ncbi:hypothetical protein M5K25_006458 [Dendrobium thyrsiflorum]|uniref:Uncharacterized protein n=1 Tax=Dendrobium thyrsiflorum TaxID=117978 RepID=A0ABD0VBL4_DENTH
MCMASSPSKDAVATEDKYGFAKHEFIQCCLNQDEKPEELFKYDEKFANPDSSIQLFDQFKRIVRSAGEKTKIFRRQSNSKQNQSDITSQTHPTSYDDTGDNRDQRDVGDPRLTLNGYDVSEHRGEERRGRAYGLVEGNRKVP